MIENRSLIHVGAVQTMATDQIDPRQTRMLEVE